MIMTMISIELEWFYNMWEPATTPSETIRMNRAGSSVSSSLGHRSEGELEGEWEEFGFASTLKVFSN